MEKIKKLSRDEMKKVVGGCTPNCKISGCGDGVHACVEGFVCTRINCIQEGCATGVYLDCIQGTT